MNTCPSPEAKGSPILEILNMHWGVCFFFFFFYTSVSFIMRKLDLENAPNVSAPIKTSQRVFAISHPTLYTLRIS